MQFYLEGYVRSVSLGRRDRDFRQLPFTSSLSSHVPGPQPPCLHPCLLMGPIWPKQERLEVPLIALSAAGQSQTLRGCFDCAELQCLLFLTPNN